MNPHYSASTHNYLYDITDFYGPGSTYHKMAGKDCSQAVARWSLEEKYMNSNLVRKHTPCYGSISSSRHSLGVCSMLIIGISNSIFSC